MYRVYVVVRYVYTVCMYNYLSLSLYIYMKIHYLLFGGRKQNLGDDCLFLSTRLVVLVIPKYIYICIQYIASYEDKGDGFCSEVISTVQRNIHQVQHMLHHPSIASLPKFRPMIFRNGQAD